MGFYFKKTLFKTTRFLWPLLVVLIGLASTTWGLAAIFADDLPLGSKFTPAGRDLSIISLAVILGIFSVLWGLADLQILRHHAAKENCDSLTSSDDET